MAWLGEDESDVSGEEEEESGDNGSGSQSSEGSEEEESDDEEDEVINCCNQFIAGVEKGMDPQNFEYLDPVPLHRIVFGSSKNC